MKLFYKTAFTALLACLFSFFAARATAQTFDDGYERRAQEVIAGLSRINGLKGFAPGTPALWPQPGAGADSRKPGNPAGAGWSVETPYRLLSLALPGQNLQRAADLSGLGSLEQLDLTGNSLKAVNLNGNKSLKSIKAADNQLASINLSSSPGLLVLALSKNKLTYLDLSANPLLTDLTVSANHLESIDLSRQPALRRFEALNNELQALTVRTNPDLEMLAVSYNRLTALDVSANSNLNALGAKDNGLTELVLFNNPLLEDLAVSRNSLTSLELGRNPRIKRLAADQNRLASLDISVLGNLEVLELQNNPSLREIVSGENEFAGLVNLNLDGCALPLSQLVHLTGLAQRRGRLGTQENVLFERLEMKTGEVLDLEKEAVINGSATEFMVLTDKKRRVNPAGYSLEGGRLVFKNPGLYMVVMTNEKVFSSEITLSSGRSRTYKTKVYTGVIEVKAEENS